MAFEIKIEKRFPLSEKPDMNNLDFGKYFTDHMFVMDYDEGQDWHDARIIPYQNIPLDPAACVLHYGVEVFEGMKAYRRADQKIQLFRPEKNIERLNASSRRFVIPQVDVESLVDAIKQLIKIDSDWVPSLPGTSLYIRPFIIATEAFLGVRASYSYKLIVILSPVGDYYPEGMDPVKIFVEPEYVRSAKGGTGYTKCGGNYAASLVAQYAAKNKGYTQVLWLDAAERKYIEEVGTMNVFFVIGDEIVTPELGGSILPGITRLSAIELLRSWGKKVVERKITIQEIYNAQNEGRLFEAFGTGTAAVVSPIGELNFDNNIISVNNEKIGPVAQALYDSLTGIQWGRLPDTFGWVVELD